MTTHAQGAPAPSSIPLPQTNQAAPDVAMCAHEATGRRLPPDALLKHALEAAGHARDVASLADNILNDLGHLFEAARDAARKGYDERANSLFSTLDYLINDWHGLMLSASEKADEHWETLTGTQGGEQ